MTPAPVITANNQQHQTGNIAYLSDAAQNRWKRKGLYAAPLPNSITRDALAPGAVTPNKLAIDVVIGTAPPATPSQSATYLVAAPATGAWTGHENELATWDGVGWTFTAPREGILIWDAATNELKAWDGTAWSIVNDFTLPERLKTSAQITDWDAVTESGWFYTAPSSTSHAPDTTDYWYGNYHRVSSLIASQVVYGHSAGDTTSLTTKTYRRDKGTTWGPWYQVPGSIDELDARYVQISTAANAPTRTVYKIEDRDLSAPPSSPVANTAYYVKPTASGAWVGHDNKIAIWTGSIWNFITLKEGDPIWIADEDKFAVWDGSTIKLVSGNEPNEYRISFTDSAGAVRTLSQATPWPATTTWATLFPALGAGGSWGGLFGDRLSAGAAAGPAEAIGELWEPLWDSTQSRHIAFKKKVAQAAATTYYNENAPGNGNF